MSSDETKKKCSNELIAELQDFGLENAGIIAARDIVDIVINNLAPDIYNKGIADARKLLHERLADVDIELSVLEDRR